ncbi:MAG TPA: hypothetical protein VFH06_03230 [Candidatus Saccharimonadales bacterium]|nr:hypothetical protein [Candidatus Saccharimonadales bacterium]
MSTETTPPVGVLRQAKEMQKAIGLEPSIEHVKVNRWRITFRNERVAVTINPTPAPIMIQHVRGSQ